MEIYEQEITHVLPQKRRIDGITRSRTPGLVIAGIVELTPRAFLIHNSVVVAKDGAVWGCLIIFAPPGGRWFWDPLPAASGI